MNILIQRVHPDAVIPTVAHPGEDLCYDLYSVADLELGPYCPTWVPTGIKIQMPDGYGAVIRPRSSMSKKGALLGGGEIDWGYRDEILVLLTLLPRVTVDGWAVSPFLSIKKGDRIAQLRPQKLETFMTFREVQELGSSKRGTGGFGSTGR